VGTSVKSSRVYFVSAERVEQEIGFVSIQFRFLIGRSWLYIDDAGGLVPGHPDFVSLCLRREEGVDAVDGCTGDRVTLTRTALLAFALRLLEIADLMLPEALWEADQAGHTKNTADKEDDPSDLSLLMDPGVPFAFARFHYDNMRRLHARMPILRAAQRLLEYGDESIAENLQAFITAAETGDSWALFRIGARIESEMAEAVRAVRTAKKWWIGTGR
jgi:hypothetical protein